MAWNKSAITNDGIAMLNKSLTGRTLNITLAVGGTGVSEMDTLATLTDLVERKQTFKLLGVDDLEKGKKINVQIVNKGLEDRYLMQQIGLFARLDGDDTDKLLCILQNDIGVEIPAEREMPDFGIEFYAAIAIDNNAQFQIVVDTSAFVSFATLNTKFAEHNKDPNAHTDIINNAIASALADLSIVSTASDVSYDNRNSGIKATNVQEAIDATIHAIQNISLTINAPPTQNGTLTYTGSPQSPVWNNYNPDMLILGGVTTGTDAGVILPPSRQKKGVDGPTIPLTQNLSPGASDGLLFQLNLSRVVLSPIQAVSNLPHGSITIRPN